MDGSRRRFRRPRPRRLSTAAFAAATLIPIALAVLSGERAAAAKADERALAGARTCAAQASDRRDCLDEVPGAVVGRLHVPTKGSLAKLKVAGEGTQTTLTFPYGVGPAFHTLQDGAFVALTTWHGEIVAVTTQGDTEKTSTAPSEQYRSHLTSIFVTASFALVLAGITLYSAVLTELVFTGSWARFGPYAAGTVVAVGFATIIGSAVLMEGGSLRGALLAVSLTLAMGTAVAGGLFVSRRRDARRQER